MTRTILLLDDDVEFQRLVVPALEKHGHRVLRAQRASEATLELAKERPDLVVVDGLLPDMDGISWIAQLRGTGNLVPVVFVSAFWRDLATFHRLTRELSVALVLHKPVIPTVFAEEVNNLLAPPEPIERPPTVGTSADFAKAMETLRADYARTLPTKLEELRQAVEQARLSPENRFLVGEARTRAHRLRGTAGSYGFAEVGLWAGVVEDAFPLDAAAHPAEAAFAQVELALDEAERSWRVQTEAQAHPVSPAPMASSAPVILVSDTDPRTHDLVRQAAKRSGFEVQVAHSVAETVALARARRPDAALIEVDLDESAPALQLVRELHAIPGCMSIPFAFLSRGDRPSSRVQVARAGASMCLVKPLDEATIVDAVRQLVSLQRANQPRILVVDDDEDFAHGVAALLRRNAMQVTTLKEPARLLDALEDATPDLLLVDLVMPGLSGFELCRLVRSTPRWQELPVLFLTSKSGTESRLAAFQAGADDYLVKPFLEEELLARIQVRVERMRLLHDKYDRDPLTGLLLRRAFSQAFNARLAEATRHVRPLSLGLIDLDCFKGVNDTYGHLAGDGVLASLGDLITRLYRAEDLRGRWGGEEFILGLPGETVAAAHGALGRLQAEFRGLAFRSDAGESFHVAFSAGIACHPADGATFEEMLRVADRRLYAAKRVGRDQIMSAG